MKNKGKLATIIILLILGVVILDIVFAVDSNKGIEIKKGKNNLNLNNSIYVRELILKNPEIESVSYFDEFLGRSIGYANAFGGVGTNFLITPDQTYEISASKDIILRINEEQ